MSEVIDIVRVTWTERLTKLKVGKSLKIGMRHYRTVTSRFSSRDFRFKYPGFTFSSSVNEDGKSFKVTRTA